MLEPRKPSPPVYERQKIAAHRPGEVGLALLLSVIILLLISAMGLSALQSAQGEASAGGRTARKLRTFFAADGALSLVKDQLTIGDTQYPDITALNDTQFMKSQADLYTQVRTGSTTSAVPQEIFLVGRARRDGDQLNINSSNTFTFGIYRTDVVATDPVGGRVELQAQYRVSEGADTYR